MADTTRSNEEFELLLEDTTDLIDREKMDGNVEPPPPLASSASPSQVRDFISSHLLYNYVLEEADATAVAAHWQKGGGKEYHSYRLLQFRHIFGISYGTVLWCDEHRVHPDDRITLERRGLPTTTPKETRAKKYILRIIVVLFGLASIAVWTMAIQSHAVTAQELGWLLFWSLLVLPTIAGMAFFALIDTPTTPPLLRQRKIEEKPAGGW